MNCRRLFLSASLMAVLGAASALAEDAQVDHSQHTQMSEGSTKLHKEAQAGAQKMEHMEMTGEVDHDFVTMMRQHHQDGTKMAQIALQNSKDPKVREFAQRIIASQKKDIAEFDAWLKSHPGVGGAGEQSR